MAILHIDGSVDISLLFCDHQDIEPEYYDIKNSISGPILTHKQILNDLWVRDIYPIQYGRGEYW